MVQKNYDHTSPEARAFEEYATSTGISAKRRRELTQDPWPFCNETKEELEFQRKFRRSRGIPDDPPHHRGVAGGKD